MIETAESPSPIETVPPPPETPHDCPCCRQAERLRADLQTAERDILAVSDREQRRFGQDLHDGLCQQLTGIGYMATTLEQKLASRAAPESGDAAQIGRLIEETIREARGIARGFYAATVETHGLPAALRELASGLQSLFNISCQYEGPTVFALKDPQAAMHLYRIAQEAVSNAIMHGKAAHISLLLSTNGKAAELRISDDGRGMTDIPDHLDGMGLRIMRRRARLIDGFLDFERPADHGTTVICHLPDGALS